MSRPLDYLDLVEGIILDTISDPEYLAKKDVRERRDEGKEDCTVRMLSMIGTKRLRNVREACTTAINQNIPGDFLEAGVWRGGCSIMMRAVAEYYHNVLFVDGEPRTTWVCDSFKGLPPPNAERFPQDAAATFHEIKELMVSLEEVKGYFARFGFGGPDDEMTKFVEGYFTDTMPTIPVKELAVLRLDGDMYESTWVVIERLYDNVSPGGFIIVDDWGAHPGCAKAMQDFAAQRGFKIDPVVVDWTGVYFRKEG